MHISFARKTNKNVIEEVNILRFLYHLGKLSIYFKNPNALMTMYREIISQIVTLR